MRRRFFVDQFHGGTAILRGDAANHLGRVLRAERGQLFELSDGESLWLAQTETVGREEIHFSLVEQLSAHTTPLHITLLLAIVKFDRFEWAIEKATELGVDEVVPLIAERSEHGLITASAKRAQRWERILAESAQQARRLRIPVLREAAKPREAFGGAGEQVRLLLSERSGASPLRALLEPSAAAVQGAGVTRVAIAIGPEGGWTDAEFSLAAACGYSKVALGANIMRTETAVCAALAALQYAFGAFRPNADSESPNIEQGKGNS
jgi:16S rRNA (uracil1498-N3)-methyltransferase